MGQPAAENIAEPSVELPAEFPVEKMEAAAELIKAAAEMGDVMKIQSIAEELLAESEALAPFCKKLINLAETPQN